MRAETKKHLFEISPFLRKHFAEILLLPPTCRDPNNIGNWAIENYPLIELALEIELNRQVTLTLGSPDPKLSRQDRSLSEMPLCSGLERIYSKIKGSTLIYAFNGGGLNTYDHQNPLELSIARIIHTFAWDSNKDIVIDFTFGQAVEKDGLRQPGQRVGFISKVIPELVTLLPDGNGVLIGQREQIAKKTGLNYIVRFSHPSQGANL